MLLGLALILLPLWLAIADPGSAALSLTEPRNPKRPDDIAAPLVLFLLLLPAANALLDWLSLGITRRLLGRIAFHDEGGAAAFLWALFDTVIAIALLFAVALLTVAAAALFDRLHETCGGSGFYDLNAYLDDIAANPWAPKWWWVYAMLLSTLIPTAVHYALAIGALGFSWIIPPEWVARQMEAHADHSYRRIWPALWLTILDVAPVILVTAGFVYLVVMVPQWVPWIGETLLLLSRGIVEAIAAWNGAPVCA